MALQLRQRPAHLLLEVVPLLGLEVVEDQEAALQRVGAKPAHLGLAHRPEARLRDVRDRMVEESGGVEIEDVGRPEVGVEQGDVIEDLGEVLVAARDNRGPRRRGPNPPPGAR